MKHNAKLEAPENFYNAIEYAHKTCEDYSARISNEFYEFCRVHGDMDLLEATYFSAPYRSLADGAVMLCWKMRNKIAEYMSAHQDCGETELETLGAYSNYFEIKSNEFKDFIDALDEKIKELKVAKQKINE